MPGRAMIAPHAGVARAALHRQQRAARKQQYRDRVAKPGPQDASFATRQSFRAAHNGPPATARFCANRSGADTFGHCALGKPGNAAAAIDWLGVWRPGVVERVAYTFRSPVCVGTAVGCRGRGRANSGVHVSGRAAVCSGHGDRTGI